MPGQLLLQTDSGELFHKTRVDHKVMTLWRIIWHGILKNGFQAEIEHPFNSAMLRAAAFGEFALALRASLDETGACGYIGDPAILKRPRS